MSLWASQTIMRQAPAPARARAFSNSLLSALRKRLNGQMGSESAELELKWMREELRARRAAVAPATSSPARWREDLDWELGELRKMVDRRMKDEPLQYILGERCSSCSSGLVPVASPNCVGITRDWLSLDR